MEEKYIGQIGIITVIMDVSGFRISKMSAEADTNPAPSLVSEI